MMTPDRRALSVVVPVRNEARYIESTLHQLIDQTLGKHEYEILVVDGASDDGTRDGVADVARRHPDVALRLLPNPGRLSSVARNIAIREGRGDYFLIVDGHVHIHSRTLLADALALAHVHGAKCLGRPQPLDPPGISAFQRAVALARSSLLAHSRESFIYSAYEGWVSPISVGVMYHRDVFKVAGPFDERFDAAEDLEFNYRLEKLGIKCYFSPKLTVYYYPRSSPLSLFRQMRRYGTGRARFVIKHPKRFRIEIAVPTLFLLTFTALALLASFGAWFRFAATGLGGLYVGLLLVEGARLYLRTRENCVWLLPVVMPLVHAGLGVGFLEGLLHGQGRCIQQTVSVNGHERT